MQAQDASLLLLLFSKTARLLRMLLLSVLQSLVNSLGILGDFGEFSSSGHFELGFGSAAFS